MDTTVAEIAQLIGGSVVGEGSMRITGLNGIREASEGDLTFISDPAYLPLLEQTRASAVVVTPDVAKSAKPLIHVRNPYLAIAVLLRRIEEEHARHPRGIHPTAVLGGNVRLGKGVAIDAHVRIGDDCVLGDGVIVYAGVYIGHSCAIGDRTLIYPNATIRERIRIGSRCIIHSGAVLGGDGFGFTPGPDGLAKVPQVGTVVIGDDVEIGANSAIDRATFAQTVVGNGTKIDNLVQIGHNVVIGAQCVLCGNAGIAGSTVLGDRVTLAAGAGISGHLEIGDGAIVAAYSGVSKSVRPGQIVFGYPAVERQRARRMYAALRLLPDALRQIAALEKRVAELEGLLLNGTTKDHR